jgi:hypothetical protein
MGLEGPIWNPIQRNCARLSLQNLEGASAGETYGEIANEPVTLTKDELGPNPSLNLSYSA